MTIQLEDFLPDVSPSVPGAPKRLILQHLLRGAQQLSRRAHIWRYQVQPISVFANIGNYQIPTPAETALVEPRYVEYNGDRIYPRTESELDDWDPSWRTRVDSAPDWYTLTDPETIVLVAKPASDLADALVIHAWIEPAQVTTQLPDWWINYADALSSFALWKLHLSPGKPYTDANLGEYHRKEWERHRGNASFDSATNFGAKPLRTRAYSK